MTATGIVYTVEEEEIDLEGLASIVASSREASKLPRKGGVGWKAHWLVIEGVQPLVPENPSALELQRVDERDHAVSGLDVGVPAATSGAVAASTGADGTAGTSSSKDGSTVNATTQPLVKHILSRELQVYHRRLTEGIMHGIQSAGANGSTDDQGDTPMAGSSDDAEVLQDEQDPIALAALSSLRSDPALHQLVPYLAQWISSTISSALSVSAASISASTSSSEIAKKNKVVHRMLASIEAMLFNKDLGMETYVHLLLPSILSCLLISTPEYPIALRSQAARLLGHVLHRYGPSYPSLKPRITRVLLEAVFQGTAHASTEAAETKEDEEEDAPRATVATKLGAVLALRACGGGMTKGLVRARVRPMHLRGTGGDTTPPEVEDREAEEREGPGSKFRLLGEWLDSQQGHPEGVDRLVEQVGQCLHDLAQQRDTLLDIEEGDDALQARIGSFWIERLVKDDEEAKKGVQSELAAAAAATTT